MNRERSGGFLFVEMLLYMALGAVLAMAICASLAAILKMHAMITGSFLLQEEARFAVGCVVRDLTYAHAVKCGGDHVVIYARDESKRETAVTYEIKRKRLMKDHQPVTGDEKLQRIAVQNFSVTLCNRRVAAVQIRLFDTVTRQAFSLESAAVLLNAPRGNG